MKISHLINKNYSTVSVSEDTRDIMEWFKNSLCLAVADDDTRKILGIITHQDLINSPESRQVLDCNFQKPIVSPDFTVLEVQQLMDSAETNFLPVFENDNFIGTISLAAIASRLAAILNENQQIYQRAMHDLRNPLSNINGLTLLLGDNLQSDNESKELIELCKVSCKQGFDILDDLLYVEMDENRHLNKVLTDMNGFFKECINEQQGLCLIKKIRLSIDINNTIIKKEVDRGQLKRAIQNVISNAVKFSHSGSTIKVSSEIEGDKITFKVVDAGIGIPEALQPYIFDKFTQARRLGTHGEATTGLGLCFSKQCIERHSGEIRFKSIEGKGTKFYIKL